MMSLIKYFDYLKVKSEINQYLFFLKNLSIIETKSNKNQNFFLTVTLLLLLILEEKKQN